MITVYPRKKLDFTYLNIFKALLYTFAPFTNKKNVYVDIENLWPDDNVIIGLSVRSIFDLLLTQKKYKNGSNLVTLYIILITPLFFILLIVFC